TSSSACPPKSGRISPTTAPSRKAEPRNQVRVVQYHPARGTLDVADPQGTKDMAHGHMSGSSEDDDADRTLRPGSSRRRRGQGVLRRADADGRLPAMLRNGLLPAGLARRAAVPVPDARERYVLTAPDRASAHRVPRSNARRCTPRLRVDPRSGRRDPPRAKAVSRVR